MVPATLGRPGAAIINIASISAEKGGGVFGNVWYAATKAAVIAMASGAAFLASNEASLITGETILVDGGLVRT